MIRPTLVLAALAMAGWTGSVAGQVRPTLSLGARFADPAAAPTGGGMALGSRFEWSGSRLAIDGGAALFGRPGEAWGSDGDLTLRLGGGGRAGWHPMAELLAAWQAPATGRALGELGARTWLERQGGRVTLRLGLATTEPMGGELAWAVGGLAAAEIRLGRFTLSGRLGRSVARVAARGAPAASGDPRLPTVDTLQLAASGPSQVPIADSSGEGDRSVSVTPTLASIGIRWSGGASRVDARLAQRFALGGANGLGWSLSTRVPAANGLALRLDAGYLPAGDALFLPNRHYLALGVELVNRRPRPLVPDPGSAGAGFLALAPGEAGRFTLTIRKESARSVEVMGDFTDWQPVALDRRLGDVWVLPVAVPSGVHQINWRVDGGPWQPPPGLPRADDGFGGEVGVLVAPGAR